MGILADGIGTENEEFNTLGMLCVTGVWNLPTNIWNQNHTLTMGLVAQRTGTLIRVSACFMYA